MKYFIFYIILFLPIITFSQQKNRDSLDKLLHIRHINFIGNKHTKISILYRELNIKSGDNIEGSQVENEMQFNKRRLLNLQLFYAVDYKVETIEKDSIDIVFSVSEIFYWLASPIFSLADRNINVWWFEQNHQLYRTNIGLEATRLNFRGRNEQITATVQVGYNKQFSFSYKMPYIDKNLKQGIGISTTYETGREISYKTDSNKLAFFHSELYPYHKFQGKVSYTYRHKYATIHELQLSYNFYSISEELFHLNPDYLNGKKKINYFDLSYIYNYNNTDYRVYPTNGIEFKTIVSKKGLGFDKDVNKFEIINQTAVYKKLSDRFSTSFIFRGRYTNNDKQPYILNRAFGFKNEYVRGYEYYVIDGSQYALLRSNLRYKIIDKTIHQNIIKLIKYIPIKVFGKIFDDIGYVHNIYPTTSFLNDKFLNGYGAGLDIVISYYFKFRIEYSFNLLHQNGLFLHGSKE